MPNAKQEQEQEGFKNVEARANQNRSHRPSIWSGVKKVA